MPIPAALARNLSLPAIGAPMFIVSNPELVIAQCRSGIIGSFPALNARSASELDEWLDRIEGELDAASGAACHAVNQITHLANTRLEQDMMVCAQHKVPLIITSLRAPGDVAKAVHGWGGLVFHDVISVRHAEKALEAGVDGLILVCAGAGGHGGDLNPFALVAEVRKFFSGPLVLSGAIATGAAILAAQALGADFAYLGTRFIATREANADPAYKQMLVAARAADIVYTPCFTGVRGNFLKQSVAAAGLDPDNLPAPSGVKLGDSRKAWRDIWSAGQGVGSIDDIAPVADVVARLKEEYSAAKVKLCLT